MLDWKQVENKALNGVALKDKLLDIDFTETTDSFGIFDSYNYQLSPNGLILNSSINKDTGAAQPARFRAFNLPYNVGQYAISTIKVPKSVINRGLDFSFWYFNTKNKYGYVGRIANFDNNEFDVDEIHGGKHNATLYAWNQGNFYETPNVTDDFDEEYHSLAIKWTTENLTYYLDGDQILNQDIKIYPDTMFPTWEIEVPANGFSSMWGGAIDYNDFPSSVIVKDYKVFNL